MEDINNHQNLDNQNDSNDANNNSQGQELGNHSSNNDSAPFHEFENITHFNETILEEEFGEIKKKLYSSK